MTFSVYETRVLFSDFSQTGAYSFSELWSCSLHLAVYLVLGPLDSALGLEKSHSSPFGSSGFELQIDLTGLQFSSVSESCPTLCDPMDCSTSGLHVHHQLPKLAQTHVHRVGDAIQPSHPLSSSSPTALSLSQLQGLFQWVNSSHEVAKVLEFQLQHQSFQRTPRTDLL